MIKSGIAFVQRRVGYNSDTEHEDTYSIYYM